MGRTKDESEGAGAVAGVFRGGRPCWTTVFDKVDPVAASVEDGCRKSEVVELLGPGRSKAANPLMIKMEREEEEE